MSKTANITIAAITIGILIIYGIFLIITFMNKSFIFAPYDPPPPGPEDEVFRPGGIPQPVSEEERAERLAIVTEPVNCNR